MSSKSCVGPDSEKAGVSKGCEGCPMQKQCKENKKKLDLSKQEIKNNLSNIKHKILILSGKGGVGKSSFTSQFAFILAHDDNQMKDDDECTQVGILDIDLCGPSIPSIFQLEDESIRQTCLGWDPVYFSDNIGIISIDFLLKSDDTAVVWRGPKKNGMIVQFLRDVYWGEDGLDFLLIDTPPGTSDEHITVCKYLKETDLDGAIIITTPQDISCIDVRKEVGFCKKMNINIIGIVENMSGFVCPNCKNVTDIFSSTSGGGEKIAKDFGLNFLGKIPLDPIIMKSSENGRSVIKDFPNSLTAKSLINVANSKSLIFNFNEF